MDFSDVNFEDELIEVIRNACPEGKEEEFKKVALEYWKNYLVADLIETAMS